MKKTVILLLFVAMFLSCKKYLTEDNRSAITTDEHYSTKTGYETLINACYGSLRTLYTLSTPGDIPFLFSLGTDLFTIGGRAEAETALDSYYTLTPINGRVERFFNECYKVIQLQNTALYWGELTEQFDELETRKREARFLRAYIYYLLVEHFGDASLVTDMIEEAITSFERKPEQEVYDFIISELEEIKDGLPLQSQATFGRVTQGAAKHFLALVYLTRAYKDFAEATDFKNASDIATEVIESAEYNLLNSFGDVFEQENENNAEIIFSIQFDASSLDNDRRGNNQHHLFGHLLNRIAGETPYRGDEVRPTIRCFTQFEDPDNDTRYEESFMSVQYENYFSFYSTPTGDIKTFYPNWNITEADGYTGDVEALDTTFIDDWYKTADNLRNCEFPMVRKFDDVKTIDRSDGTRDLFLFRLAETHLIRAEALIEQGQSGDDDINIIRQRAGWNTAVAGATVDDVLDERGRELLGEYKRWLDLKRTGRLIQRAKLYNPQVIAVVENGQDPFDSGRKLLRPIPQSAIDRDAGNYPQNPGY